jgi:hypothetical protein
MRRQSLGTVGETIQNLFVSTGVAGGLVALAALAMPADKIGILFKMTAPYSVVLAGLSGLAVSHNARRNGFNSAIELYEGMQNDSQNLPPVQAQQIIPALPSMAQTNHPANTWAHNPPQQYYGAVPSGAMGSQPRAMDPASNGHRQSVDSSGEPDLY